MASLNGSSLQDSFMVILLLYLYDSHKFLIEALEHLICRCNKTQEDYLLYCLQKAIKLKTRPPYF